jgi:hypothetical protein
VWHGVVCVITQTGKKISFRVLCSIVHALFITVLHCRCIVHVLFITALHCFAQLRSSSATGWEGAWLSGLPGDWEQTEAGEVGICPRARTKRGGQGARMPVV